MLLWFQSYFIHLIQIYISKVKKMCFYKTWSTFTHVYKCMEAAATVKCHSDKLVCHIVVMRDKITMTHEQDGARRLSPPAPTQAPVQTPIQGILEDTKTIYLCEPKTKVYLDQGVITSCDENIGAVFSVAHSIHIICMRSDPHSSLQLITPSYIARHRRICMSCTLQSCVQQHWQ